MNSNPGPFVPSLGLTASAQNALARIHAALGLGTMGDITEVLSQAADRLDKAAKLMEQMQSLRPLAKEHGFQGESASQLIQFAKDRIEEGSRNEAISSVAKACESLNPELAFDDAHALGSSDRLLVVCLRTIEEAASRASAQEVTISVLVQSLKNAPGGWPPAQEKERLNATPSP